MFCLLVDRILFFQAEDGIRDLVRSRGLGDVYKRQVQCLAGALHTIADYSYCFVLQHFLCFTQWEFFPGCLLYTSDAADERSSVDLGGRRIIKKKKSISSVRLTISYKNQ